MSPTSDCHGVPIYYDDSKGWCFMDGVSIYDEVRPCPRCGRMPTPDDDDACIGHVPFLASACCGHGLHEPYATPLPTPQVLRSMLLIALERNWYWRIRARLRGWRG